MDTLRSGPLGCYEWARFAISLFDGVTDLLVFGFLVAAKEWNACGLILSILLLSLTFSVISVALKRCVGSYTDPMPYHKWCLLTVSEWGTWCEPTFNSGPQFVVQLALVLRAVRSESFDIIFDDKSTWSWPWFEAVVIISSLMSSFSSLLVMCMHDGREKGGQDSSRFFSALLAITFCVWTRGFMLSAISTITLVATLPTTFVIYFINLIVIKCMNREGWCCLLEGFVSLLCPTGQARVLGSARRQLSTREPSSTCEVERVKINQEKFFVNSRLSYLTFGVLNLLLFVTYVSLSEVYLKLDSPRWFFEDRKFLYVTPAVLLVLFAASSSWHLQQIRAARDATRTWNALTLGKVRSDVPRRYENVSLQMPLHPPSPSAPVFADVSQLRYVEGLLPRLEDQLSKHINRGTYRLHQDGDCVTCEILVEGTSFQSTMTGKLYKFMPSVSCTEKNVIYLVTCHSCSKQYVGKTEQELRQRHYGHRREIDKKMSNLGMHFSETCGYTSFRLQLIDQIHERDNLKRKKELQRREGYWMQELATLVPMGLNSRDEASNMR